MLSCNLLHQLQLDFPWWSPYRKLFYYLQSPPPNNHCHSPLQVHPPKRKTNFTSATCLSTGNIKLAKVLITNFYPWYTCIRAFSLPPIFDKIECSIIRSNRKAYGMTLRVDSPHSQGVAQLLRLQTLYHTWQKKAQGLVAVQADLHTAGQRISSLKLPLSNPKGKSCDTQIRRKTTPNPFELFCKSSQQTWPSLGWCFAFNVYSFSHTYSADPPQIYHCRQWSVTWVEALCHADLIWILNLATALQRKEDHHILLRFNDRKANSDKFTEKLKYIICCQEVFLPENVLHLPSHKINPAMICKDFAFWDNSVLPTNPHISMKTEDRQKSSTTMCECGGYHCVYHCRLGERERTLMRALGSWPEVSSCAISFRSCLIWRSRLLRSSLMRAIASRSRVLLWIQRRRENLMFSSNNKEGSHHFLPLSLSSWASLLLMTFCSSWHENVKALLRFHRIWHREWASFEVEKWKPDSSRSLHSFLASTHPVVNWIWSMNRASSISSDLRPSAVAASSWCRSRVLI